MTVCVTSECHAYSVYYVLGICVQQIWLFKMNRQTSLFTKKIRPSKIYGIHESSAYLCRVVHIRWSLGSPCGRWTCRCWENGRRIPPHSQKSYGWHKPWSTLDWAGLPAPLMREVLAMHYLHRRRNQGGRGSAQYFTLETLLVFMHAVQIAVSQCILRSAPPNWNCFLCLWLISLCSWCGSPT